METLIEQMIPILIAIITAIIAWYKNKEAKTAVAETQNVQDFFDPDSIVTTPPENTPKRSYLMSDSVRQTLIAGESIEDQNKMLKQVEDAESAGILEYAVYYSKGHYKIQYGQIRGW